MEYFLGIDIGTTSVKSIAFNREGKLLYEQAIACITHHPFPEWSQQDPDEIFRAVVKTVENILQYFSPDLPVLCSFSCAMHSLIIMDNQNEAITPSIIWADNRAAAIASEIHRENKANEYYERTGLPVHAMSPFCKILWFKKNQPLVFKKAHKFIGIKEYIFFKLFGEYVMDISMANATGLMSGKDLQWDEWILRLCEIGTQQLSVLVDIGKAFYSSPVFPDLHGVPFIIGGSDGAMANLGSTEEDGALVVTVGTSSAARIIVHERNLDAAMRTFCYYIRNDQWLVGGASNNGGIVLQWLQEEILKFPGNMDEYLESGFSCKPGADGLLFLPYLLGERAPIWNASAKGILFGLHINHGQPAMIRAALEGVIYCLYAISRPLLEKADIRKVYATGGFARNEKWVQIAADLFNLPVLITETIENSAWGAAKCGMQVLGIPVTATGKVTRTFHPNTDSHQVYQAAFHKSQRIYSLLKNEL